MNDERTRAPATGTAPNARNILNIAVDLPGDGMRERLAVRKTSDE